MSIQDLRIMAFNSVAFFISFSNIEAILKIILLLVSIIYTGFKIIELRKNDKKL